VPWGQSTLVEKVSEDEIEKAGEDELFSHSGGGGGQRAR